MQLGWPKRLISDLMSTPFSQVEPLPKIPWFKSSTPFRPYRVYEHVGVMIREKPHQHISQLVPSIRPSLLYLRLGETNHAFRDYFQAPIGVGHSTVLISGYQDNSGLSLKAQSTALAYSRMTRHVLCKPEIFSRAPGVY